MGRDLIRAVYKQVILAASGRTPAKVYSTRVYLDACKQVGVATQVMSDFQKLEYLEVNEDIKGAGNIPVFALGENVYADNFTTRMVGLFVPTKVSMQLDADPEGEVYGDLWFTDEFKRCIEILEFERYGTYLQTKEALDNYPLRIRDVLITHDRTKLDMDKTKRMLVIECRVNLGE